MKDFEKALDEIQNMNERLDKQEAASAVVHHQTRILASILSPDNLREQTKEIADLRARVEVNTRDVDNLRSLHNGKHPPISD